jgi:hypothetical protein
MPVVSGNLTSTVRVKEVMDLQSSDTRDDAIIHSLINSASALVSSYCKRDFKYGSVTERIDGLGDCYILTDKYPIIAVTTLHIDSLRTFGATSLQTEDTHYYVEAATGKIRGLTSGVFTWGVANIQVVYTHGPAAYKMSASNNTLAFVENGTSRTATVAVGDYNAVSFATALQTAMDAVSGGDTNYTVTYDVTGETFTITMAGTSVSELQLNWTTSTYMATLMGFDTGANDTGATTYISDEPSPGVITGIEEATRDLVQYWSRLVYERDWGVRRREVRETVTMFEITDIPPLIRLQLDLHVRRYVRTTY